MTDEPSLEMSPEAFDRRMMQFWMWNGEPPVPQFTHWTKAGTFTIRPCVPGHPPIMEVLFNGRFLGNGSNPISDAQNLVRGSYDKELGFPASSTGVPADVGLWNNL